MPAAPVDDHGTSLSYIDSGPVEGEAYTTLVCVHGHSYHSQNFRKLLSIAPEHNMRIVALDRRDYQSSTQFSVDELIQLKDGSLQDHKDFLCARGLEIGRFLRWFVETHHIPRASDDGTSGGLALLGWSAGNMTTLAFLGHVNSFPSDLIQAIEPYLRTFFIYEITSLAMGMARPAGIYSPLADPNIPEGLRAVKFGVWISSYYQHPDSSLRTLSGLQTNMPPHPHRLATNETIDVDVLASMIDPAPGPRSEAGYMADGMRKPLADQLHGALFDPGHTRILPRVKVQMVYCTESIWAVFCAVWAMEDTIEHWKANGIQGRPLKFVKVDGANHFLHWEDPKRAMAIFTEGIRS